MLFSVSYRLEFDPTTLEIPNENAFRALVRCPLVECCKFSVRC